WRWTGWPSPPAGPPTRRFCGRRCTGTGQGPSRSSTSSSEGGMRRFLAEMALFSFLQAGVLVALHQLHARRADGYLAATLDKEHRLATLPGRRVVLIGGSNLAFGMDSAVVERLTGRPVVNVGLYGNFGVAFMLDEARRGLRPGDATVIAM